MGLIQVKASRSFLHFRAGVFGSMLFLRLAWGFLIAFNAFSNTTRLDKSHQTISIYLFVVNTMMIGLALVIACIERWKKSWAYFTSQVAFEIGWIGTIIVLEIIGAIMFAFLFPSFGCSQHVVSIFSVPEGANDLRRRGIRDDALMRSACEISNMLASISIWIVIGLTLLYETYFCLLAMSASWHDKNVWFSQCNKFDWSVTSDEGTDPRTLARPENPHMGQVSGPSSSFTHGSKPIFTDPFTGSKIPTIDTYVVANAPKRAVGRTVDRHQMMAHYQDHGEPVSASTWATTFRDLSLTSETSSTDHREVAAWRLEGLTVDQAEEAVKARVRARIRPQLTVNIPGNMPSTHVVHASPNAQAYENIGRSALQLGMPFQSSTSSLDSRSALPTARSEVSAFPKMTSDAPAPKVPPFHLGYYQGSFVPFETQPKANIPVQHVGAPRSYPEVIQSPNRKSTLVGPINYPNAYPRQSPQPQSARNLTASGAILPMHNGDLTAIEGRVIASAGPWYEPQSATTSRHVHMHGLRVAPSHNRGASDSTWPPHVRQSRHVPTYSAPQNIGQIPSLPIFDPSYGTSRQATRSVYGPAPSIKNWTYPISKPNSSNPARQLTPTVPATPKSAAPSRSGTARHSRPEGSPFGLPNGFDSPTPHHVATWEELDQEYRAQCEREENRGGRGKLRKPDPRVLGRY